MGGRSDRRYILPLFGVSDDLLVNDTAPWNVGGDIPLAMVDAGGMYQRGL